MKVNRLELKQFRNIEQAELYPHESVNILFGENAQGKTNILEALWLFTGGKSFRGAKDKDMCMFGKDYAKVIGDFDADDREQQAEIVIQKNRQVSVNGIVQQKMSTLIGRFPEVIFFPDHLFLVKEGPEERRRFMDAAICQIKPSYIQILTAYYRILEQRNSLLKEWRFNSNEELLEVLTLQLAKFGQQIVKERLIYTDCLKTKAVLRYAGLSGNREELTLDYEPGKQYDPSSDEERTKQLLDILHEKRKTDLDSGYTTVGPHREDLQVKIDGISARNFGSQGQQRSAVLALKLAEAEILKEKTNETPLVLLDDVMSELDKSRQEYIVNQLTGWQVFISCCEPENLLPQVEGKLFHVKQGQVEER